MRRYWIDSKDRTGDVVVFKGDLHHHIFDVCRQDVGSKFEVLSEDGKAALVEVIRTDKKSAEARVIEERTVAPLKNPLIKLVMCVPRFNVMDSVLEKAVELGVKSIQPVFSEYSFVRSVNSLPDAKFDRWNKIIKSATQQSGRGELMDLLKPMSLDAYLESFNQNRVQVGLFAYEGPSVLGLKEELLRVKSANPEGLQEISIFVGAEGGFSTQEVSRFEQLGLKPVTLGQQILRVETACMALVSALKYEFDLMS